MYLVRSNLNEVVLGIQKSASHLRSLASRLSASDRNFTSPLALGSTADKVGGISQQQISLSNVDIGHPPFFCSPFVSSPCHLITCSMHNEGFLFFGIAGGVLRCNLRMSIESGATCVFF